MLPGSYGSLSKPVLQARNELTTLIERNPDKFMRLTFLPLFTHVRERLAKLIGTETDELVLIPNASQGINTVLWNFEWRPSDILVVGAHNAIVHDSRAWIYAHVFSRVVTTTYNSILKTAQYLSDRAPHPQVSKFNLEFPTTHAKIISSFRDHLRALPRQSSFPDKPQQVVAVIDSLVSNPGVLLPWKEMVKICREEGVFSVVDAAHSIGQEVGIDVGASGCDFWISVSSTSEYYVILPRLMPCLQNCHKWLFAERVCAMLYVPKRLVIAPAIPDSTRPHRCYFLSDLTGINIS